MKVVLASKNKHKLEEISKITQQFDMELVLQSELGVDIDVEENGSSFEENSLIKAKAVMEATGLPALADDSGIAVDALNGEPGIYSARSFTPVFSSAAWHPRIKTVRTSAASGYTILSAPSRTASTDSHIHTSRTTTPASIP